MNTRFFAISCATAAVSIGIAACGGGNHDVTPTTPATASDSVAPTPTESTSDTAAALPTTWSSDMPKDQQMAFMKTNVIPAMTPVFQGHDSTRYADFGCKTCHGPEYKNPHDFLPKLTMKGGKLTAFAEKPEVSKFMAESVAPKMAAAMGEKPYDMTTHEGFGCGGCHSIETK